MSLSLALWAVLGTLPSRQVSTLQSGLGRVPRSFKAGNALQGRQVALGALAIDIS